MTADFGDVAEFSIKAVAQATGLSVETLRAWERRYGVIEPRRGAGGHRIYSTQDVARLRRLRETTSCGHPIGKVAHLTNEQLALLLKTREPECLHRSAAEMMVTRILGAVESYQPPECDQLIAMAFALLPTSRVITDVLAPTLREVGSRWERGKLSIGQERILSCAVRRKVMGVLNTFQGNTYNGSGAGPLIVFATLSGERHELGILMCAALAASFTLRLDYLGADLPAEVIADHAERVGAAVVAISVVMADDARRCQRQLIALRRRLPQPIGLWVGGGGAEQLASRRLAPGIVLLTGFRDFEQRAALLARAHAP
jgi:DNA-binding transcriptional MerR regulator/methylmalonyl-CoA mutase cobalamin-binding subunit